MCFTSICWHFYPWYWNSYLSSCSQSLLFSSTLSLIPIQICHPLISLFNILGEIFWFYQFLPNHLIYALLNSFINNLSLYSLLLTAFLNSCTNFFITLFSYSNFFNSATFIISLYFSLNSFFRSIRYSSTVTNSKLSFSRSSIIFSFQMSTNSPYTYNKTHYTCSSTDVSLIFILIYNLHTIKNLKTLLTVRKLALPRFFSSMFFGWSMFHDPFSYPHSSTYLISHALDPFKLYTNTPNHLNILLNSLSGTSLLFCNTLWSSQVY